MSFGNLPRRSPVRAPPIIDLDQWLVRRHLLSN